MKNRLIHNPVHGKLKVLGFASGSGNTLWKTYELQKEMEQTREGCPFEIVGVFSDKPDSKAVETAKTIGMPYRALDLRKFHASHNAPLTDLRVRALYDQEVAALIEPFGADLILLAGYVWATTEAIVDHYQMVNVHPADLSVAPYGHRLFAGADGVGDTLRLQQKTICSSAHLATAEIDGGPLLMRSPSHEIDYSIPDENQQLRKTVLKAINEHSRHLGARVILEIAQGRFALDQEGRVIYEGSPVPGGVKIESWQENVPKHQRQLKALMAPESVVVIGASARGGLGKAIVTNIQDGGYSGRLYAVNRSGGEVSGVKAYEQISQLPEAPDLAVVTLPSMAVLEAVEACGQKGVKVVVCISAGFKEVGDLGAIEEMKLRAITDRYNMRLLGPNCMGVLNTAPSVSLNATMLQHQPTPGSIAFITQSGALGAALLDYAENLGMGFSKIASLGNQMDIDASDLLAELRDDPETKVVLLYLETIGEGQRFVQQVSELTKTKPVIIVKSGRSSAGAAAASSHTGSIAGSDAAVDALIEKSGAIRVDTLEMAYLTAMSLSKASAFSGNRIGVVTNAGGPGILITDRLAMHAFELPLLPDELRKELAQHLLPEASTGNPIDLVAAAPPEHYAKALEAMAASGCYDALAVICVPPATIDTGKIAEGMVPVIQKYNLPVISCFIGPTLGAAARQVLNQHQLPCLEFPEIVADVLKAMNMKKTSFGKAVQASDKKSEVEISHENGMRRQGRILMRDCYDTGYLRSDTALKLLDLYGIPTPKWHWVTDPGQTDAGSLRFPVVAKIEHPEVLHKSDAGGVVLNIVNQEALTQVVAHLFESFPGAEAVLVQEQASITHEVILGGKFEPGIGHLCLVGAGGTLVELFQDVSVKLLPVCHKQATSMLESLKTYPLLNGYRGKTKVPVAELAGMVENFSRMIEALPGIQEIDLNPVTWDAFSGQFMAVDCRIRVE